MCIHEPLCMSVCMYVLHVCMYRHVCTGMYVCVCLRVCMQVCVCACVRVPVHVRGGEVYWACVCAECRLAVRGRGESMGIYSLQLCE